MKISNSAPIGIFDSGIGGLTVVRAVMDALPNEDIIYFGDTARVPYGIKSVETVKQYAVQITEFLMTKKVKMILIACNTVTAAAEAEVRAAAGDIPVLGVIEAGSKSALQVRQRHHRVAVIGTLATVGSSAYQTTLQQLDPNIQVFSKACSLLVPLAEEGWTDNEIAELTLRNYLEDIRSMNIDSLILGCTHYPLFKDMIEKVLDNPDISIIDSAISIASMAQNVLSDLQLLNNDSNPSFSCYVSDKPQRFQQLAERFLGRKINRVEIVTLV
jgi:glutamate racemase